MASHVDDLGAKAGFEGPRGGSWPRAQPMRCAGPARWTNRRGGAALACTAPWARERLQPWLKP